MAYTWQLLFTWQLLAVGIMPRAKLSDPKPRGRMSAYAFFVQRCREQHKITNPDESVVFSEFSRTCADRWKNLDDKDKQPFQQLADQDKTRYYAEMSDYRGPRGVRGRKRRQRKDPNAPKRPLSAFLWFCGDERPKVKAVSPNLAVGDVAKELGLRWSTVSEEVKLKCEERARKDRARYLEEMKAFKSGEYSAVKAETQPPKHATFVPMEEGDEEEDSDEEEDEED